MILLLATLLALAPQPAPLAVSATLDHDGALIVSWQAPAGQARAAIVRADPAQLLGTVAGAAGAWVRGPGSVDAHYGVRAGDTIVVTAWNEGGALLGQGRARVVGPVAWLPVVARAAPVWRVRVPVAATPPAP